MDAETMLGLADNWMGEGMELARRMLAFADQLRGEMLDSATKTEIAGDLEDIIKGRWNPLEQPR